MGTQKGRVDVQQQPPSLLQTPQLPGAAPARPEVTRLLPTTRLRLALPLSISLLPPSFALYTLSLSLSLPFSLLLSSSLSLPPSSLFLSLAHHHSPTRTPLHCHLHAYTLEGCAYLSLALFLSLIARTDSTRDRERFAANGSEARGFSSALWNCRGGTRRRDAHVNAGYDVPQRARCS